MTKTTQPSFALVSQASGPRGRWVWLAQPPYSFHVWAFFLAEERFLSFNDLMCQMTGDKGFAETFDPRTYAAFVSILESACFPQAPETLGLLVIRGDEDFPCFSPGNFESLTHELVHLINRLLDSIGYTFDPENDEPQAYLTGRLFSACASAFASNTRFRNNWNWPVSRNVARFARRELA